MRKHSTLIDLIDFEKVDSLLEGFNKSTGYLTAILDLEGNVLSKSGWRKICTEFHRVHPETSQRCTISDTVLANKMKEGEKYHFYQCLNGLIDVAVPIVIRGEHIANLFSGQFFFEKPDAVFFKKQAEKYGFNEKEYLKELEKVPVVSKEEVLTAMDFLLDMTQLISDMAYQKLEQMEMTETIRKSEQRFRIIFENSLAVMLLIDPETHRIISANKAAEKFYGWKRSEIEKMRVDDINTLTPVEIKVEMEKARKSERIYFRFKHRLASGDVRDVEIYSGKVEIDGKDYLHSIIHDVSEQVVAEKALKESELYNRMLFEQSQIGLALTNMDGKLVDINSAFASIIGRTIEETKQLTYWEITPEKYARQEQEQLELLAKTGKYGPYEKEYIHKDGHLVPVRLQGLIIERNNEKFIWSSVEDISEQKKAETDLIKAKEEIEASEKIKTDLLNKLNEAQHNAKIGSWEWDLTTGHVWWSDELFRIFELDPEKFTPSVEANARYVHPDDNEAYHKEVARAIQKKEELNFDLRIISGMGNLKYCNSRAVLDYDETGNPIKMSGTFADITSRKKTETDLIESETKYRYLFKNNPLPMWIYDLETLAFMEVNEAAIIYYGYSETEFKSITLKDIRPEEDVQLMLADVEDTDSSYNKAGIWRHRKKNGEIILVEIISHLVDFENKAARLVLVNDVTEKKQAEEALRKSEERFRVAQDFSPDGFTILHPLRNKKNEIVDFTWVYENKTIARINGTKQENVIGRRLLDVFPTHKGTTVFETYIQVANSGKPKILEEVYAGEVVSVPTWLRLVVVPMEEDIAILAQDITERKKNEEKIKQNETRLQSLVNVFQHQTEGIQEFLDYALKEAIKLTGSKIGYIYFYSEEKKEFTLNTWSNGVMEICSVVEPQTIYQMEKTGIWGEAVRQRREIVVNNFKAPNPLRKGLPEGHAPLFRYMTIPVFSDNKIVAVLGLANKESDYEKYDVLQVQLLMDALWKEVERKRGEKFLAESEERFRAIVEGAPDPIFIQTDHKFVYLNKPALHSFGAKSQAELLGKPVMERFHPDFHKLVKERIRTLNEQKKSVLKPMELKFIRMNGEEVWVETTGEPIFYNGKHGGLVFVRDISERKNAEAKLAHWNNLMKYIIEHNQSAIAVHDKNLNYLFVSQRYLTDYKVKEKDVIGKHHYDVFPDIPEKWRKVHQKALKGIVSRADEDKFYREDGTLDWTRWECRPWYEADGSIGGMVLYTEVINEQKRKEEEIKKLNQRLEILIESIQQLAAALSLDTVQDIVAKSARKLIGADGATLVFRENDNCFYVNEDAIQPLWKGKKFPINTCVSGWVMQNKKPVSIEDIFSDERIPKDVYEPTFVKSLAMVPVNINEPIGAIGNYWKEKYTPTETEMQLLQTLADAAARAIENINLYAELEERVKRRTEQLQTANKELETFTYSVSHDLKAPLRGIDGYSKLLLNEYGNKLNEEAAHFIQTIRSSTLQMNQLIEDLLSYSRLERSEMKNERIELKRFMESLMANYHDELKVGGFKLQLAIPDVEMITSPTGLSIVIRNLLENAIKFTREKPNPKIEIGAEEKAEAWIINVKDNGVGFDMKYHDRIFEIFQRLHRAEDFPGTGIGLAMVAKALQRMEGKARAESKPDEGATFFIEIPKTSIL